MSGSILVFDSGIGGLSVLAEIKKSLPLHQYIYLFDNARLPYGELADQALIDGCVELIVKQVKQHKVAIVVIACNTASTLVLPALRAALTIPIVGVVPAIKPAALISRNQHIALLATPATVKRTYTDKLINQFATNCQVERLGSSELVLLAEQQAAGQEVAQQQYIDILRPLSDTDVDVVVLGCTHFPMIRKQIAACFNKQVLLLDSGQAIANRVCYLLANEHASQTKAEDIAYFTREDIDEGLAKTLSEYGFTAWQHIEPYSAM